MKFGFLSAAVLLGLAACSREAEPSMAGKFKVPANLAPTTIPLIIEGDQILFEVEADGPSASRKLLVALNLGHGPHVARAERGTGV